MFATGIKAQSTEHRFVPREGIEANVKEFVNATACKNYIVIYDNKGIGKSSSVEHVLTNMEGVAMVHLINQRATGETTPGLV